MAKNWFIAGAAILMAAGGGHALLALLEMVRPAFLSPVDDSVKSDMERTTFRFRRLFPFGDDVSPTMWRLWLGFNASHGIGVFTFGLVCLMIARHDYTLVERIDGLQALTIAFPAVYCVIAVRYWFYAIAFITVSIFACFTLAALAG
jgi:hypothetical protein